MRTHTAVARSWRSERGQSLIETALTLPLLLLVSVGIFEFGRAYQTWQVVTNAAREGARMAVLPGSTTANVQDRVRKYLSDGSLPRFADAGVDVTPNSRIALASGGSVSASLVTVNYPFQFMVFNPIARLVVSGSTLGADFTMSSSSQMRNESPF
jgi:Flp pilus assembly protein TadG